LIIVIFFSFNDKTLKNSNLIFPVNYTYSSRKNIRQYILCAPD
jgi:hypothetical protein